MNINEYFKKTYTVAFRLTGDEAEACEMAFGAIKRVSAGTELSDRISFGMLQDTAEEICSIFLSEYDENNQILKESEHSGSKAEPFQNALMALSPLSRTAIVWRDVLGFKIDDMTAARHSGPELYSELNKARRQMKELLADADK